MFLWSEGFICYRKISALLPSNGGGGTPKKTSQPSLCHVDLTWPNFKMGREKKKKCFRSHVFKIFCHNKVARTEASLRKSVTNKSNNASPIFTSNYILNFNVAKQLCSYLPPTYYGMCRKLLFLPV